MYKFKYNFSFRRANMSFTFSKLSVLDSGSVCELKLRLN